MKEPKLLDPYFDKNTNEFSYNSIGKQKMPQNFDCMYDAIMKPEGFSSPESIFGAKTNQYPERAGKMPSHFANQFSLDAGYITKKHEKPKLNFRS